MKDKATVAFRRAASGEVTGEIINENGEIISSKNFGIMTEEGYRRVLKLMEQKFPDIGQGDTIELTGN
jgi:hypothetical protein